MSTWQSVAVGVVGGLLTGALAGLYFFYKIVDRRLP